MTPVPPGARRRVTALTPEETEALTDALWRMERREADRSELTRIVSSSERLDVVLTYIAAFVERHVPDTLCFVWARRGQEVRAAFTDRVATGIAARVRSVACPPSKIPASTDSPRRPLFDGRLGSDDWSAPYFGAAERFDFGRLVSLPICNATGVVLGVLDVLSRRPVASGQAGLDQVIAAADLAAIAIEQRRRQSMLSYQAQFDPLTHLPNRYEIEARLQRAIAHARRHDHMVGLLYVDLDRFKHVNDTLGHAVGDALLREVAGRFETALRTTDSIARMGGDEFAAVLTELDDTTGATRVAQKLMETLQRPIDVAGYSLVITTTIGIALFPHDGADAATLLRNADAALQRAKESGRDSFRFFAADMHHGAVERLEMETALRESVARRGLDLYLQPQLDVRTGATVGFEALARWSHPKLGDVSPARFIPLAEETRLIADIGRWALEEACRSLRDWLARGGHAITIGVNVSPVQLARPDFVEQVADILGAYGVDPHMIELEITESATVDDFGTVVPKLEALRALGFCISIDDFGTGYSNLAYLQRLPIDRVKIDRSFVAQIDERPGADPAGSRLVKAIVDIAHTFDLDVVAEGVETTEQLSFLRNTGCEVAQGFLYHRPMPAREAIQRFVRP